MQPSDCRNCHGFPVLHRHERAPQASCPEKKGPPLGRVVLCKLRAIPRADLERIVAGLSLTAGGVLGVLVARIVG